MMGGIVTGLVLARDLGGRATRRLARDQVGVLHALAR